MYICHHNSKSIRAEAVNKGLVVERSACETAAETMSGTRLCATSSRILNADRVHRAGAQHLGETLLYKDMLFSS